MLRRLLILLALPLVLGACAGESVWAPDEVVERARYEHDGPPELTLYTMVNNQNGSGAHSSLMINASQRVIFDPAGSVTHETIPERNDVLFGVTPGVEDFYTRAHARKTYHVVVQRIPVSAQVAELALRKVMANGPVAPAMCSAVTSRILSELPGFESVEPTWYPNRLAENIDRLPGVTRRALYEYDDDDKTVALRAYQPELVAAQNAGQ